MPNSCEGEVKWPSCALTILIGEWYTLTPDRQIVQCTPISKKAFTLLLLIIFITAQKSSMFHFYVFDITLIRIKSFPYQIPITIYHYKETSYLLYLKITILKLMCQGFLGKVLYNLWYPPIQRFRSVLFLPPDPDHLDQSQLTKLRKCTFAGNEITNCFKKPIHTYIYIYIYRFI